MSEYLALKTDNIGDWQKKKQRSANRDLAPRPVDDGRKSTWAHCDNALVSITKDLIQDPRLAPCELQALALLFFDQRSPSRPRRNRIKGVSLKRKAVRPDLVSDDTAEHPIKNYSSTHRSLLLGHEAIREEVIDSLFAQDESFYAWTFTRQRMAEVLEELLADDCIAIEFQRDARSLLLEWQS